MRSNWAAELSSLVCLNEQSPRLLIILPNTNTQYPGAPFGDQWFFFEPFLASPEDIGPLIASQEGWREGVSRNASVIHDAQLVVAGKILLAEVDETI